MVRLWAANTDLDWFDFLSVQPGIDEVNFWQPSGYATFGAIGPGELFLFKLKSPRNVIGGFGVLSQTCRCRSLGTLSVSRTVRAHFRRCAAASSNTDRLRKTNLILRSAAAWSFSRCSFQSRCGYLNQIPGRDQSWSAKPTTRARPKDCDCGSM